MRKIPNDEIQTANMPDLSEAKPAELAVADLLVRVGERVRRAREELGMPRRSLSEVSGVSPRYLALLETGNGNISIGLLMRVALALNKPMEWLVSDEDTNSALATRENRVCLLGMAGAGKSTLGQLVAQAYSVPFVRLTDVIEELSKLPVSEVVSLYGKGGYRTIEVEALKKISEDYKTVIVEAPSDIVSEPATYSALLTRFHSIWIKAAAADYVVRTRSKGDPRPEENASDALIELKAKLAKSEVLFERALAQIDTSGRTVDGSLKQLLELLQSRGYLGQ